MSDIDIERKLWFEESEEIITLPQSDLLSKSSPLIILGEAGMGKTHLLEWLGTCPGYTYCTARKLINRQNPLDLMEGAKTIVIDALDEVSSNAEGDAVDLVLNKLGELKYPNFIVSCRVADWRSATGKQAINEQYSISPLELHIEPLDEKEIIKFLDASPGCHSGAVILDHFNSRGLSGLLGNPQTLILISRVASNNALPESKHELFESAVELLRKEHADSKAKHHPAKERGLDAAGAAFAALILTGNESISRKATANILDGELSISELVTIPSCNFLEPMLDTRLFRSKGSDKFSYWHRSIGEYLGARWLSKCADSTEIKNRLLSLFHGYQTVPSSLRGIHAWLARDPSFSRQIIEFDPIGFIEYGSSDDITVAQARWLLKALESLSELNPFFYHWSELKAYGLAKNDLLKDISRILSDSNASYRLLVLILESIKGWHGSKELRNEIHNIVSNSDYAFVCRSKALEVLQSPGNKENWQLIAENLYSLGDEDSLRLAIELIGDINFSGIESSLVANLAYDYSNIKNTTLGVLMIVEEKLAIKEIESVLNHITSKINSKEKLAKIRRNNDLADFTYKLIARLLEAQDINAETLWSWLSLYSQHSGYNHQSRKVLAGLLATKPEVRRSVQKFVLLDQSNDLSIGQRLWRLIDCSSGFTLNEDDAIWLLGHLDPNDRSDERWREILCLVYHDSISGLGIRKAARIFASHRPDLQTWIENLAFPKKPKWELREAKSQRRRIAKEAMNRSKSRATCIENRNNIREGKPTYLVGLAKVYLRLFSDIREEVPAHKRISDWIGDDIAIDAHQGFEAFLTHPKPSPTAVDIANAISNGRHYPSSYIIIAALSERIRKDIGFSDLPNERIMAGLFSVRNLAVEQQAGINGIEEILEEEIERRGCLEEALTLYYQTQFEAKRDHIDSFYKLVSNKKHSELICDLALKWLTQLDSITENQEGELLDLLIGCHRFSELRPVLYEKLEHIDESRKLNWIAVGLIIDFENVKALIESTDVQKELIWHLRNRSTPRDSNGLSTTLKSNQIFWIISTFRSMWPITERPGSNTRGDDNEWNASEFLQKMIRTLGNDESETATVYFNQLINTQNDGYTNLIKFTAAEQAQKQVEAQYTPPSIEAFTSIINCQTPKTAADLQAYMIEELRIAQAKIRSDDIDSWTVFFDGQGNPLDEERCRDRLLGILRQSCSLVTLEPETHISGDREVDITCTADRFRLPIEIKGQWHKELWTAADSQLSRLYIQDWRAEGRGIYLVLWFGDQSKASKKLKSPGKGKKRPKSPPELLKMLFERSQAMQSARVIPFVLDLTNPEIKKD